MIHIWKSGNSKFETKGGSQSTLISCSALLRHLSCRSQSTSPLESRQREAKNEVSEDILETLTKSKVDIADTEIEAARGCTKLHETAEGPVETA